MSEFCVIVNTGRPEAGAGRVTGWPKKKVFNGVSFVS